MASTKIGFCYQFYFLIILSIGIPLLVLVGFVHFKRSRSFKSEVDILVESNPYQKRNTVNSELNLRLNLKILSMTLKVLRKENLSEAELQEITKTYDEIMSLSKDRDFKNNLDLSFLKKEIIKL